MPRMMIPFDWSKAKEKIQSAVRDFFDVTQQSSDRFRGLRTNVDTNRTNGTSNHLRMEFDCKSASANAHGLTGQGMSFIVLKGSVVSSGIMPSLKTCSPGYHKLRCRLENDGTIVNGVFTRDCEFASPSAAASVVMGRPTNGRIEWIAANGRSLKEVQEEWRV